MEDIFSFAKQMADSMPEQDKQKLQKMENVDQVMSNLFGQVMQSMQNGNFNIPISGDPVVNEKQQQHSKKQKQKSNIRFEEADDEEDDDDDCILQKTRDIHYNLNVKLEDLYNGKQKKISFKRKVINEKNEIVTEKKKIIINILPGMKDGETIIFPGESDQAHGYEPGNVVITICEDEHELLDREGDNLFMMRDISFTELYKLDFSFKHLDGRHIRIKSKSGDALHINEGIRKITGEGMPLENSKDAKGDLFIRFNLILPDNLEEHYNKLKEIIPILNKIDDKTDSETKELETVTEEDMEKLEDDDEYDSSSDDDDSDDDDDDEDDEDDEEGDSDDDLAVLDAIDSDDSGADN